MPISSKLATPTGTVDYLKLFLFVVAATVSTIALIKYIYLMSTTSLWQDELYSIRYFSTQGAYTAWTDYHLPNNHILFNVINSVWPLSVAYEPLNARLLSFALVSGGFVLLIWQAIKERSWAGGAIALLLIAYTEEIDPWNFGSLDLILQARAYGITFAAAVLLTIAVREYLQNGSRVWLALIGVATFLGGAALPTFVFLAAPMMAGVLLLRRRADVLIMIIVTGVIGVLFYLPTVGQILGFADEYGDRFGRSYAHPGAIVQTLMYFFGKGASGIAYAILFVGVVGGAAIYGDRKRREFIILGSVAVIAFFLICLAMGTPKVRTTQFACAVLAVLLIVGGSERAVAGLRAWPGVTLLLSLSALPLLVVLFKQIDDKRFLPIEAYRETAEVADTLKPAGATIFAPFRTWQFAVHLKDGDWPVDAFDAEQFRRGEQIVVNSNHREKGGFHGTDYSPSAFAVRVPQRRRRGQAVWLVAPRDNSITDVAIAGPEAGDSDLILDGRTATKWSAGAAQSELAGPIEITFSVDPTAGCDRLFVLGQEKEWPAGYEVVTKLGDESQPVSDDAIRMFDQLMLVDLEDRALEEISLTAKLGKRNRPLSIREAWCESAPAS